MTPKKPASLWSSPYRIVFNTCVRLYTTEQRKTSRKAAA